MNGHEGIVRLLLESGAKATSKTTMTTSRR
jgi:hypothetical protein